jgi:hypothetical protein
MATLTREDLKNYCLRALGEPVVEINVDDDQLEDRLDEAIEYWHIYHPEGMVEMYAKHQVTTQDITNRYIPIPDAIYGITKVYPISAGTSTSKSIFDLQYQLRLNDLYDLTSVSIVYYQQVMNHLSLLDMTLNRQPSYRFNRLSNKLYIDTDWVNTIQAGEYILFKCYRALDPTDAPRLYNEGWLKHYTTALFKKQWAVNIKKFQGLQLPGGVTLDGDKLYDEAVGEIKDLEEELQNKAAPLEFFMG